MSDEFVKIATKEIHEEISELKQILSTCKNDADILSNADKFQEHTHKIKGLAPMMGKEELGSFSSVLDLLLKKIMDDITIEGIFNTLSDSIFSMNKSMIEPVSDFEEIQSRISQILNSLT